MAQGTSSTSQPWSRTAENLRSSYPPRPERRTTLDRLRHQTRKPFDFFNDISAPRTSGALEIGSDEVAEQYLTTLLADYPEFGMDFLGTRVGQQQAYQGVYDLRAAGSTQVG